MDGVLVDFESGLKKQTPETLKNYEGHEDDIPGIFDVMDPVPGAIDAVKKLSEKYDCYILSTSPWGNPTAMSDKHNWIKRYFDHTVPEVETAPGKTNCGNPFHKKMILTHNKALLNHDRAILIDDRTKHGADQFGERHIHFGSAKFPNWQSVVNYLLPL